MRRRAPARGSSHRAAIGFASAVLTLSAIGIALADSAPCTTGTLMDQISAVTADDQSQLPKPDDFSPGVRGSPAPPYRRTPLNCIGDRHYINYMLNNLNWDSAVIDFHKYSYGSKSKYASISFAGTSPSVDLVVLSPQQAMRIREIVDDDNQYDQMMGGYYSFLEKIGVTVALNYVWNTADATGIFQKIGIDSSFGFKVGRAIINYQIGAAVLAGGRSKPDYEAIKKQIVMATAGPKVLALRVLTVIPSSGAVTYARISYYILSPDRAMMEPGRCYFALEP
jgi:hypothetical protein